MTISSCTQLGLNKENDDDTSLLLLAAAAFISANNCTTFPETMVDSATPSTWTCTISGLTRTCTSGTTVVKYTYPSIAIASLGIVDSPTFVLSLTPGFRGSKVEMGSTTGTYTTDSENRITKMVSGATTWNYSNHDTNGFPQNISGSANGTITYAYAEGGHKPTKITYSFTTQIQNYSNGIMTSYDVGSGVKTITSSGSISMCQ